MTRSAAPLRAWLLACALAAAPALSVAQDPSPPATGGEALDAAAASGAQAWAPRTGDAASDRHLADINRYAVRHPGAFVDELVRYFNAPRALVESLLAQPGWTAGDLYYACAVARVTGRPCRSVAEAWARQRGDGWQQMVQGLGIAPGSVEATRLRQAFAASYARWARPLPTPEVDAARAAYANGG